MTHPSMDDEDETMTTQTSTAPAEATTSPGTVGEVAPGTAYVHDATATTSGVDVHLTYVDGRRGTVHFDVVPADADHDLPPELHRLIAVQVTMRGFGVECKVLGTSDDGPTWVPIGLTRALAFAIDGAHVVLRTAHDGPARQRVLAPMRLGSTVVTATWTSLRRP